GASIRVASADYDSARIMHRQPLAGDDDRRGADAILREHAGGGGRRVADDQSQVRPFAIRPNAAMNGAEAITAGEMHVEHKDSPQRTQRSQRKKAFLVFSS